jgi:uncharacterized protein YeaO (DUF488 family)
MIQVKRVYEPPAPGDGLRFLVDRLWPRGVKKAALPLNGWLKDLAPSDALRGWFQHDPAKWKEFERRYHAELKKKPELWQSLLNSARKDQVTILFSAKDTEHNNAVALKSFLESQLKGRGTKPKALREKALT